MLARPLISDSITITITITITSMSMSMSMSMISSTDVRFIASTIKPFNVPQPRH